MAGSDNWLIRYMVSSLRKRVLKHTKTHAYLNDMGCKITLILKKNSANQALMHVVSKCNKRRMCA